MRLYCSICFEPQVLLTDTNGFQLSLFFAAALSRPTSRPSKRAAGVPPNRVAYRECREIVH